MPCGTGLPAPLYSRAWSQQGQTWGLAVELWARGPHDQQGMYLRVHEM